MDISYPTVEQPFAYSRKISIPTILLIIIAGIPASAITGLVVYFFQKILTEMSSSSSPTFWKLIILGLHFAAPCLPAIILAMLIFKIFERSPGMHIFFGGTTLMLLFGIGFLSYLYLPPTLHLSTSKITFIMKALVFLCFAGIPGGFAFPIIGMLIKKACTKCKQQVYVRHITRFPISMIGKAMSLLESKNYRELKNEVSGGGPCVIDFYYCLRCQKGAIELEITQSNEFELKPNKSKAANYQDPKNKALTKIKNFLTLEDPNTKVIFSATVDHEYVKELEGLSRATMLKLGERPSEMVIS